MCALFAPDPSDGDSIGDLAMTATQSAGPHGLADARHAQACASSRRKPTLCPSEANTRSRAAVPTLTLPEKLPPFDRDCDREERAAEGLSDSLEAAKSTPGKHSWPVDLSSLRYMLVHASEQSAEVAPGTWPSLAPSVGDVSAPGSELWPSRESSIGASNLVGLPELTDAWPSLQPDLDTSPHAQSSELTLSPVVQLVASPPMSPPPSPPSERFDLEVMHMDVEEEEVVDEAAATTLKTRRCEACDDLEYKLIPACDGIAQYEIVPLLCACRNHFAVADLVSC